MDGWKMSFLLGWYIFRAMLNFQGVSLVAVFVWYHVQAWEFTMKYTQKTATVSRHVDGSWHGSMWKISLQIPWRACTPSTPPSRLVTGRGGCALDCLYDWHIFDTMIIILLQYSYLMKSPKTNTTKVQDVSIHDLLIWYVFFVGF